MMIGVGILPNAAPIVQRIAWPGIFRAAEPCLVGEEFGLNVFQILERVTPFHALQISDCCQTRAIENARHHAELFLASAVRTKLPFANVGRVSSRPMRPRTFPTMPDGCNVASPSR